MIGKWIWTGKFVKGQLLSVLQNLPYTFLFQRRRSAEDELTMREYLHEGDLISVTHYLYNLSLAAPSYYSDF